jgi:hypothetical protein
MPHAHPESKLAAYVPASLHILLLLFVGVAPPASVHARLPIT